MIVSTYKRICSGLAKARNMAFLTNRVQFYSHMEAERYKRVGFVIDIDGTVVLSGKALPGAKETLDHLEEKQIPYLLLTNNVARSEKIKAKEVSDMLGLKVPLKERQVILNYTPIKHKLNQLKDGVVLIVGREFRLKDVLPLNGMEKFITIEEYCTIFPQSVPLSVKGGQENKKIVEDIVRKRLNLQKLDKYQLKIVGVVILTTPTHWDECYQVIIDVLSTKDGKISRQHTFAYPGSHIPVMTCYNDMYHIGKQHNLPRLLMKPFNEGLKTVYKLVYGVDLQIETYGKPHPNSYGFAKDQIQSMYGPVDQLIMVGDNLQSDILGPIDLGWDTILVKTGVNRHDYASATINCQTISEGVFRYLQEKVQQSK